MCATGEGGRCMQLVRVDVLSRAVLSSCSAVVQYNRVNPLTSTSASLEVHFPDVEFGEFARTKLIPRIVIPGDFLKALVTGTPVSTVLLRTCEYSVSTTYM